MFPGAPGLLLREPMLLGEGFGQFHVALDVLGGCLVWKQGIAVMPGEVVFIGDQYGGDGRVILVGKAGVGVDVPRYCSAKRFIVWAMVSLT